MSLIETVKQPVQRSRIRASQPSQGMLKSEPKQEHKITINGISDLIRKPRDEPTWADAV